LTCLYISDRQFKLTILGYLDRNPHEPEVPIFTKDFFFVDNQLIAETTLPWTHALALAVLMGAAFALGRLLGRLAA
jgi:hypothetical protein